MMVTIQIYKKINGVKTPVKKKIPKGQSCNNKVVCDHLKLDSTSYCKLFKVNLITNKHVTKCKICVSACHQALFLKKLK